MEKVYKTYDEQLEYLYANKKFIKTDSDKAILIRNGYFNLINGYKEPFVTGFTKDKDHIYYPNTSLKDVESVKLFDEKLRYLLFEQITRVEQQIRQLTGYKLDEINRENNIKWDVPEAYDGKNDKFKVINFIAKINEEIKGSNQGYVKHYKNKYKFIPSWIMLKSINFSTLITLITYSKAEVKLWLCLVYNITTQPREKDFNVNYDFKILLTSLNWLRKVRNSCAHNERIYGMKRKMKFSTPYHDYLGARYVLDNNQTIMDAIIFLKYYTPADDYQFFVEKIYNLLNELSQEIDNLPFSYVKNRLGIKKLTDLMKLLENPNHIDYYKL